MCIVIQNAKGPRRTVDVFVVFYPRRGESQGCAMGTDLGSTEENCLGNPQEAGRMGREMALTWETGV